MADLNNLQAAQTIKIAGADSTGLETGFVGADSSGRLNSNINQYKIISTVNSSTANLAANATFTGTGESSVGVNGISISFFADKDCRIQCQQSIDNTNWDIIDIYDILANINDGRAIQINASFFRILVTNRNQTASTTILRLQTILIPIVAILPKSLSNDGKLSITNIAPSGSPGFVHGKVTASAITAIRNTTYTEQTTNAQRSIVSSSASDAAAGTGARTIRITYLADDRSGFFTETLTLNGTTPVNTVNTNICFIEKIEVKTSGSFGANQGTISLKAATSGGGATIWSIAVADNVTFGAQHYIPLGKRGYIQSLNIGCSVGDAALFHIIYSNPLTGTVSPRIDEIQCGTSVSFLRNYTNPLAIPSEFFRFLIVVTPDAAGTYYASIEHYEV